MVERGWMGTFDSPEFWNPKIRGANCLNSPAARFVLPFAYKRTELVLAGHSKVEVIAAIAAALDKKELPALEPGGVCYMMSKPSYLSDDDDHNGPHLMFYEPVKDDAAWGANMDMPVMSYGKTPDQIINLYREAIRCRAALRGSDFLQPSRRCEPQIDFCVAGKLTGKSEVIHFDV